MHRAAMDRIYRLESGAVGDSSYQEAFTNARAFDVCVSDDLEDIVNCEVIVKKNSLPGSKTPNSKFRLRLILKPNKGHNFGSFSGASNGNEEKLRK